MLGFRWCSTRSKTSLSGVRRRWERVIDKVGRYHEQLGHEVIHLSADFDGVTAGQQRRSLELFQSDVAPVLRERIPSRPLSRSPRRKKKCSFISVMTKKEVREP